MDYSESKSRKSQNDKLIETINNQSIIGYLHQKLCQRREQVKQWFDSYSQQLYHPFYSSYDIRDSGFKIACVDANIFPAGFNNICDVDKDSSVEIVKDYFLKNYGNQCQRILLLTEEHTHNPYYWQNIDAIENLLVRSGLKVQVAIPSTHHSTIEVTNALGQTRTVPSTDKIFSDKTNEIDLIISNNDFSESYSELLSKIKIEINPSSLLGWHKRRKHQFFCHYNHLMEELAQIIEVDPWLLTIKTTWITDFVPDDHSSRGHLAEKVQIQLDEMRSIYQQRHIKDSASVFVKNNAGTYGLAVASVQHGEDILGWNYKSRKKMKAAKGGRAVDELIIQEGIPSIMTGVEGTAEPVIYMIGPQLAGGFLRTHSEKGPLESLNSPGAVYEKLCISDLDWKTTDCPKENV